jgi:hypothetical protein
MLQASSQGRHYARLRKRDNSHKKENGAPGLIPEDAGVVVDRGHCPRCIGMTTWVNWSSPTGRMTPGLEEAVVSRLT